MQVAYSGVEEMGRLASLPRRLFQKSWLVLLILSGLLFTHALYLRYGHDHREISWENPFQYDEVLPAPLPPALNPSENSKLTLVVFLPHGSVSNRIQYLGALHRVHQENGLRVIGVTPPGGPETEWSQVSLRLPFKVVPDHDSAIHTAFRVPPGHGHGGLILLDSSRRVKFHAFEIPEQDDLRQIVEKHLLGEVDYSYRNRHWSGIKPGEPLPLDSFTRVGSDSAPAPDARNRLLVLLPPTCAACQVDYLASQVSAAAKQATGKKPALVFPTQPDTAEWRTVGEILRPDISEFWANRNPSLVWDDYYTRYAGDEAAPVFVVTDARGYIVSVKSVRETLSER